ncbi:GON-4-like protein [Styela clava]
MDENNLDLLCAIEVDDGLEGRLKDRGISRRNVRSIIHELFTNESVLKLLETEDAEPELDFTDAPVTRSKRPRTEFNDEFKYLDLSTGSVEFHKLNNDNEINQNENSLVCCNDDTFDSTRDIHIEGYDDDGKFNWQTWLTGLENTEKDTAEKRDEYDSEEDPDFNFLAEAEEFDVEDFRDDCVTRISKRELRSLNLRKRSTARKKNTASNENSTGNEISSTDKICSLNIDDYKKCKTVREKLMILRCNPKLKSSIITTRSKRVKAQKRDLSFTIQQKENLLQQMQQHVQLLTQVCLLEQYSIETFYKSRMLLYEIDYFRQNSFDSQKTQFNIPCLSDALSIVQQISSSTKLTTCKDNFDREMKIIANSNVFMYKELLPVIVGDKQLHNGKRPFSFHEDCLIARGIHEMSGNFILTTSELISRFMLPCRTSKEIKAHINYFSSIRSVKNATNPIVQYKAFKVLPEPADTIIPVLPYDAKSPMQMDGDLPEWLTSLQQGSSSQIFENGSYELDVNSTETEIVNQLITHNFKRIKPVKVSKNWTRKLDELILTTCKCHDGATKGALDILARDIPTKTKSQIRRRFYKLLSIFHKSVVKS